MHWEEIVDRATARHAQPERLVWPRESGDPDAAGAGATLVIRADAGAALTLQHTAPQLIERINVFFGWRAVARLKLVQHRSPAPLPEKPAARTAPSEGDIRAARERVAGVDHAKLSEALVRLGAHVNASAGVNGRETP